MSDRGHALEALNLMRTAGWSLTKSAQSVGLTRPEALVHVRRALRRRRGRWKAKKWDRLTREMKFWDEKGAMKVEVKDSRTAAKIGAYANAVKTYLSTGDSERLDQFRNQTFQSNGETYEYLTDLTVLEILGSVGEVSFEDLYSQST